MTDAYLDMIRSAMTKKPKTYTTSQDTELLRRTVNDYHGIRALEIGFGAGWIIEKLGRNFEFVAGTELVVPPEAANSIGRDFGLVVADRATCFRSSTFDLVVFNPPYLPSERIGDIAVDGGPGGIEIPLLFLGEAVRVVCRDGCILLVLSSEGDLEKFEERCRSMKLQVRVVAERDLFYETLYVYEAKRAGEYFEALRPGSASALI